VTVIGKGKQGEAGLVTIFPFSEYRSLKLLVLVSYRSLFLLIFLPISAPDLVVRCYAALLRQISALLMKFEPRMLCESTTWEYISCYFSLRVFILLFSTIRHKATISTTPLSSKKPRFNREDQRVHYYRSPCPVQRGSGIPSYSRGCRRGRNYR
jgi:hypothetical protein